MDSTGISSLEDIKFQESDDVLILTCVCLSLLFWHLKLLELVLQDGADTFGVPMELKSDILFNLQDACSTMDPPEDWEGPAPEELVMQLASVWEIDLQQFDK